ncbi:hypothetical protein [Streptomyces bacillaris]
MNNTTPSAGVVFRNTWGAPRGATGTIAGFGIGSYRLALRALADELTD